MCLQETKLGDGAFPALAFETLGYTAAHYGQGQWNGVAVLSRVGITDVVANFAPGIEPDVDARVLSARCGGILVTSVYVPNGRSVDHEQYAYKLDWLGRLLAHLDAITTPADDVVVGGDQHRPGRPRMCAGPCARLRGATRRSARARRWRLRDWGLVGAFRRARCRRCIRGVGLPPVTLQGRACDRPPALATVGVSRAGGASTPRNARKGRAIRSRRVVVDLPRPPRDRDPR